MSTRPLIVAAACSVWGVTISAPKPARHNTIINAIGLLVEDHSNIVQGFLTSDGRFLDRMEAKALVAINGQEAIADHHPTRLYSEDLW